jgi:hypothetical protein
MEHGLMRKKLMTMTAEQVNSSSTKAHPIENALATGASFFRFQNDSPTDAQETATALERHH